MKISTLTRFVCVCVACAACGGAGAAAPNQRLGEAKATAKSAEEGASNNPQAMLHLKLAQEQIERAESLMAAGDYQRADYVLIRAKEDAELAAALEKATLARQEALQALVLVNAMQTQNKQDESEPPAQGPTTPRPAPAPPGGPGGL
jgi:hypothetical protein